MRRLKCWRCWIEGERNTRAEFVTAGESRCLYHASVHYLSSVNIVLKDSESSADKGTSNAREDAGRNEKEI